MVARVYSRKRLADTAGIEPRKVQILFASFMLSTAFVIMIYYSIYYELVYLEMTSYALLIAAMLLLIPLSFRECLRKSDD